MTAKNFSVKNLLAALLSILLVTGCKKDVSELPAATQTGANNFGAKVNGQLWVPTGLGFFGKPKLEAFYGIDNSVTINARNLASTPKESEFEIRLRHVTSPGVYQLNNTTGNSAYYVERKLNPTGEWKTNNELGGQVTITLADTVNKILSGTFSFKAASLYNETPIEVTEGRFDVKVQ